MPLGCRLWEWTMEVELRWEQICNVCVKLRWGIHMHVYYTIGSPTMVNWWSIHTNTDPKTPMLQDEKYTKQPSWTDLETQVLYIHVPDMMVQVLAGLKQRTWVLCHEQPPLTLCNTRSPVRRIASLWLHFSKRRNARLFLKQQQQPTSTQHN